MSAAVVSDLALLAPGFHQAVLALLRDCEAAGLDAVVFESFRTRERQEWLYAQGRTRPGDIVTRARSALYSWHGYGLAVDIISRAHAWDRPDWWWRTLALLAERHELVSGYRWEHPHDPPHVQWGGCPTSPTAADRRTAGGQGIAAVWGRYGAEVVTVAPLPEPAVVATLRSPETEPPNLTSDEAA